MDVVVVAAQFAGSSALVNDSRNVCESIFCMFVTVVIIIIRCSSLCRFSISYLLQYLHDIIVRIHYRKLYFIHWSYSKWNHKNCYLSWNKYFIINQCSYLIVLCLYNILFLLLYSRNLSIKIMLQTSTLSNHHINTYI